jgi:hypothetical protein
MLQVTLLCFKMQMQVSLMHARGWQKGERGLVSGHRRMQQI